MSKSKGNVVTPMHLLQQYGSDAVRYWAASARPGVDTAFDEGQMKIGRRLAIKLLNASKFALGLGDAPAATAATIDRPVDRAMLAGLASLVEECTSAFDGYDYARSLERTEAFFWDFCDNYLELVKGRAYATQGESAAASARAALQLALETLLKLFAPFLPFATEEVWSWWRDGSVHASPWPDADAIGGLGGDAEVYPVAREVLGAARRAKTEAKRGLRAPIASARVTGTADQLAAVEAVRADLMEVANIAELTTVEGGELAVAVTLAED
jgi:valyl-tRNA synthetase